MTGKDIFEQLDLPLPMAIEAGKAGLRFLRDEPDDAATIAQVDVKDRGGAQLGVAITRRIRSDTAETLGPIGILCEYRHKVGGMIAVISGG